MDNLDSHLLGLNIRSTGSGPIVASGAIGSNAEYVYNMNHKRRGKFILINNKKFKTEPRMPERTGTDVDASNLMYLFEKKLGFDVQRYDGLTAYEMLQVMIKIAKEDHSQSDCLAVGVLSHGDQGILYGVDGIIELQSFIDPIKTCESLAGKPKLFFIQACRGNQFDDGVEVKKDADKDEDPPARIPQEADFLFAFSTTPGHFSWRNSNKGSWFVQALYRVLSNDAHKDVELVHLLTRVNKLVAYDFESNAAQPYMNNKKQVPSIVSQLTKEVYFKKK